MAAKMRCFRLLEQSPRGTSVELLGILEQPMPLRLVDLLPIHRPYRGG